MQWGAGRGLGPIPLPHAVHRGAVTAAPLPTPPSLPNHPPHPALPPHPSLPSPPSLPNHPPTPEAMFWLYPLNQQQHPPHLCRRAPAQAVRADQAQRPPRAHLQRRHRQRLPGRGARCARCGQGPCCWHHAGGTQRVAAAGGKRRLRVRMFVKRGGGSWALAPFELLLCCCSSGGGSRRGGLSWAAQQGCAVRTPLLWLHASAHKPGWVGAGWWPSWAMQQGCVFGVVHAVLHCTSPQARLWGTHLPTCGTCTAPRM